MNKAHQAAYGRNAEIIWSRRPDRSGGYVDEFGSSWL
jgi:hypothetical protein